MSGARIEYEQDHKSAIEPVIQTHPDNIAVEVEAWATKMEDVFAGWDQWINEYTSSNYRGDMNYKSEVPENPAFEWFATMKAQFISGQPQYTLRPMRADLAKNLKSASIAHSLNRLARDQNWKRGLEKLMVDWGFRRASWRLNIRSEPHLDRGPLDTPVMRPYWTRVPPKRLIYDARALEWEETLMRGDEQVVSKSALQRYVKRMPPSEGWLPEVIDGLAVGAGMERILSQKELQSGNRDDLVVRMIWFPDEQLDEDMGPEQGFFGTVRWYAESERNQGRKHCGNLVEIRKPQPWFGPRTGPYGMQGQHYVPDQVEPLSMLIALRHVAKSFGVRSKTMEDAMSQYRRFAVAGGAAGRRDIVRNIKNAKHNSVLGIPGFDGKNIKEVTTGGIDAAMSAAYQFDAERVERIMGLSNAQRGQTKAGVTATAEIQAAGGANARAAGTRDNFYDMVREIGYGIAWMMDANENFYMTLPPAIAEQTGVSIGAIRGGRKDGESFDDYELNVEPLSMKYRSEEEKQAVAQMELELFSKLAPLVPQTIWWDSEQTLRQIGEAYGIVDLPERLNWPLAEQIAGAMLGVQFAPGTAFQSSPPKPQPFNAADQPKTVETTATVQKPAFGQPALSAAARPGQPMVSGRQSGAKASGAVKSATAKAGAK